jgi:hypothetical protein
MTASVRARPGTKSGEPTRAQYKQDTTGEEGGQLRGARVDARRQHLAAARFSEVSHGTELWREEDGGEEAAVECLNAFAGAFFVSVSDR